MIVSFVNILPCRHNMIALRMKLKEPLFNPTLCKERWTCAYYRSTQRFFSTFSSQSHLNMRDSKKRKCHLSQHEKYRKALLHTSELASVASTAGHVHFHRRLKLIKELDHWKSGEEVGLVALDDGWSICMSYNYYFFGWNTYI